MSAWVSGIDISKWQGNVNWTTVRDSGIQYVYMRAFNGNRQDSTLQRNAEGARLINMPFGLYTYWRPKDSAEEQATRLIAAHRTHGATLIPMIDVEHQDDKTPDQIAASVTDGVRIIEQELGVSPVIYTAAWFWNPAVSRNHNVGHCPLWLARYSVPNPIPANPQDWPSATIGRREPVIPHGWNRWDAWQFSADGNHMGPTYGMTSSHLDLNILRGDVWPRFDATKPIEQPKLPTPDLGRNLDVQLLNSPIRVYDSRHTSPHSPSSTRRIRVTDAEAAFVNITVVNPSRDGYITAWGAGPMPNVSNVNYQRVNVCCTAWVPLDDGHINVFTSQECHLLVDLQAVA